MIYVPWAREHPECRAALAPFSPVYADVSGDPYAYGRMIERLWRRAISFVIVEHDVLVRPDTLPDLLSCRHPWCAYSVWMGEGEVATFGCVRFAASILEEPWLVPATDWQRLDAAVEAWLVGKGHVKHVHYPALAHLNPGVVELDRRRAAT